MGMGGIQRANNFGYFLEGNATPIIPQLLELKELVVAVKTELDGVGLKDNPFVRIHASRIKVLLESERGSDTAKRNIALN